MTDIKKSNDIIKKQSPTKEHTIRVRVDENIKQQLEQISANTNLSTSEVIRQGIEQQYNNVVNEHHYLKYKLCGFEGLSLKDNNKFIVNNALIKAIYIQDDLKSLIVELQDTVLYKENKEEIERYLNHVCFNLIIQTEADINQPVRYLEVVKDGSDLALHDRMQYRESIKMIRNFEAESIYNKVINSPTAFDRHYLKYERIFKTLHNPNLIMQFMNLYQYLMELLSIGKGKVEQRNVTEYFAENTEKYDFVTFSPTRRIDRDFQEDMFTYIRNEIGHSEEVEDLELYKKAGSQITGQRIKQLVYVLNDVIISL